MHSHMRLRSADSADEAPLLPGAGKHRPLFSSDRTTGTSTTNNNTGLVGRRISRFLSRCLPGYGKHSSIEKAWDYLEYFILPRRMKADEQNEYLTHQAYEKAPPGIIDAPTSLYPAWRTPLNELRGFGTGIVVYFETLRALVIICLMAWILYLPTILYYRSDAYSASKEITDSLIDPFLSGSLICTRTEWVPCPTCDPNDWAPERIARRADGSDDEESILFVLRNACAPMRWQEGINHLVVVVFLVGAIVALGSYQKRLELQYDEDVLTAQDFSLVVHNPPGDAKDPGEWQRFFSQFGKVAYCTVALDNEHLVAALVQRRLILQQAGFKLRMREDKSPLQKIPSSLHQTKLHKKLQNVEGKCRELISKETFDATSVFVTFELEDTQRHALRVLSVSKLDVATCDIDAMPPEYRFRGNLVLNVGEPTEPSEIRWQDLNETLLVRTLQRMGTGIVTVGLIGGGFLAVKYAFRIKLQVAAFLIAILNVVVPDILRFVNKLESHAGESSFQASLFAKISIFRFVNTAIVTILVKSFTSTIANDISGLIPAVHAVLKAEIVTAPLINMLDIAGNFKRHILAPWAENQAAMNSYFQGTPQSLGEKYTNMTKITFLCFFYSVIFPPGFLYGSIAIAATYYTDKFLLLRSWGRLPELGNDVAKLSRRVFFPVCLVFLAICSELYWSAYPFDNTCEGTDELMSTKSHPRWIGTYNITTLSTDTPQTFQVTVTGDETEKMYRFCDEDFMLRVSHLLTVFEMEQDEWMSNDQVWLTFLFGLFCIGVLLVVGFAVLVFDILPRLKGVVLANYSTREKDSGKRYSEQSPMQAYIPQVKHDQISFPLLACDIKQVESRHIGWFDPFRDHTYYSLMNDVEFLLANKNHLDRPVLSVVNHWKNDNEDPLDKQSFKTEIPAHGYGSTSDS